MITCPQWWGQYSILRILIKMLTSSGNTPTYTPRNDILLATWSSLISVKLTHEMKHHIFWDWILFPRIPFAIQSDLDSSDQWKLHVFWKTKWTWSCDCLEGHGSWKCWLPNPFMSPTSLSWCCADSFMISNTAPQRLGLWCDHFPSPPDMVFHVFTVLDPFTASEP